MTRDRRLAPFDEQDGPDSVCAHGIAGRAEVFGLVGLAGRWNAEDAVDEGGLRVEDAAPAPGPRDLGFRKAIGEAAELHGVTDVDLEKMGLDACPWSRLLVLP